MGHQRNSFRNTWFKRGLFGLGGLAVLGIAGFSLWPEHKAELLGSWPYLLILLCPAMHIFMHKNHSQNQDHQGHGNMIEANRSKDIPS